MKKSIFLIILLTSAFLYGCDSETTPTTTTTPGNNTATRQTPPVTPPISQNGTGTAVTPGNQEPIPDTSLPAAKANVTIINSSYSPAALTVNAGTTVTWKNQDSVSHTVTSDDGLFKTDQLNLGQIFSYTFNAKGTYNYYCTIHPTMKGTIIVK